MVSDSHIIIIAITSITLIFININIIFLYYQQW